VYSISLRLSIQPLSNTYDPVVILATSPPLKPQSHRNGHNCASHPPRIPKYWACHIMTPRYTILSKFRALPKRYHPDLGHSDASEAEIAAILSTPKMRVTNGLWFAEDDRQHGRRAVREGLFRDWQVLELFAGGHVT